MNEVIFSLIRAIRKLQLNHALKVKKFALNLEFVMQCAKF